MYTITLSDGTKLENLELNGNNFISEKPLSGADFEGKLGRVAIDDGETSETHECMELVQITTYPWSPGKWWFILRDTGLTRNDLLHRFLDDTDWIIVKIQEAELYHSEDVEALKEKYAADIEKREAARAEINELETDG